jgi:hypothetical protein
LIITTGGVWNGEKAETTSNAWRNSKY